jgi:hypothetical protein
MRLPSLPRLLLLATLLSTACGSEVNLDEITIEICPAMLGATEGVELIVARPGGFSMPLPPDTRLEDFNGESPDELVWQVPEPSGGWREFQVVHLDHLIGTETLTARVSYNGGSNAVSPTLLMASNLRLPVCLAGADGGIADAGVFDADLDAADAGPDSDGGILQDDIQVTTAGLGDSTMPSMVAVGSELAVAWVDNRHGNDEIYFARLTAAGAIMGNAVRVTTDGAMSSAPSLVWTGIEFAVAWHDFRHGDPEIYFQRIDTDGTLLGSALRVTNDGALSFFPSLVYNDNGFAIAWEDTRDGAFQLYITFIDVAGAEINDDIRVTTTDIEAVAASLVWNDSQYGLAWHDKRHTNEEIYFATLSAAGAVVGLEKRVTIAADRSSIPSLVWNGSGYAIAWEEGRNGSADVYFRRLDGSGDNVGPELVLSTFDALQLAPDLLWTGTSYALAWSDFRNTSAEIMFAAIDSSGNVIGSVTPLTDTTPDHSSNPSLAQVAGTTKAIWEDTRLNDIELFFEVSAP